MSACLDVPLEIRINGWDRCFFFAYLWGILGLANPVILTFFYQHFHPSGCVFWICSSGGGPVIFDLYVVEVNITTKSRRCLFPENENHLKSLKIKSITLAHRFPQVHGKIRFCFGRGPFHRIFHVEVDSMRPIHHETSRNITSDSQVHHLPSGGKSCIRNPKFGPRRHGGSSSCRVMALHELGGEVGPRTATCTRKNIAGWEVLKGGTPRIVRNGLIGPL